MLPFGVDQVHTTSNFDQDSESNKAVTQTHLLTCGFYYDVEISFL